MKERGFPLAMRTGCDGPYQQLGIATESWMTPAAQQGLQALNAEATALGLPQLSHPTACVACRSISAECGPGGLISMAPLPSDCGPTPIAGARPVVETVSAYVRLQLPADDFDVFDFAASQTTPIVGELFNAEFDKLYAVLRKDITSPLVVDGPL